MNKPDESVLENWEDLQEEEVGRTRLEKHPITNRV